MLLYTLRLYAALPVKRPHEEDVNKKEADNHAVFHYSLPLAAVKGKAEFMNKKNISGIFI